MMLQIRVTILVATLAAAILWLSSSLAGEVPERERDAILKEARELARAGNHEASLSKIEALYRRDPADAVVVRAYSQMLLEISDYERAEEVLRDYVSKRPEDLRAQADLATVCFKTGQTEAGRALIGRIVDMAPQEIWPYQVGLEILRGAGMAEGAVELISRARQAMADSTVFAAEAARIYADKGSYRQATWEYLLASKNPETGPEAGAEYILALARSQEARPGVISGLKRAMDLGAFPQVVGRALWEVLLMDGGCQQAWEEISQAVKRDPGLSNSLVFFARRARDMGCYSHCSQAIGLALSYADRDPRVAELLLEKARCERAGQLWDEALGTYEAVADRYRDTKWASLAWLARGRLYREMGRLDEAISQADAVISSQYSGDVKYDAILFKGDCLVMAGALEEAFGTYDMVTTDWPEAYAQEAFFNLGEVSLYRGDFEGATSYYNVTARQYAEESRANDAIDRLLLVKSSRLGETYAPALKDFALALLLNRQGKTGEALAAFQGLAGKKDYLGVEALYSLSGIYVEMGAPEDAIGIYKILGDSLDTHRSPLALEAIGDIYQRMGRTEEAISAYEDVILKFPGSVSAGEARRKIAQARKGPQDES
jgi:tetratricopeptide (TPR) repeat protein